MADESETMSATLRFPFQASLDGSALVETDGNLYYGLDTSHGFAELPAEVDSTTTPNSESDSQSGLGLGIDLDGDDCEERQQKQQLNSNIMAHPPRWDSLRKDQELEEATPRPASLPVHPHRINTSDQQRFATEHEMTAAEEEVEAEEDTICESPSLSTLEETVTVTQTQTQTTIRLPVPLSGQLPRYYATPLTKDDPTSTPVALYGLEKPSDHVPRKKAPAVLRQRGSNPVAASVRPSSRHLHQPSPLSSTVRPDDRVVEEPSRSSTSSTRRLSMFLGRTSYPTAVPSTGVTRPAIGSISSSGSSATTSTTRSAVTTASETSTASSISTSTFSPPPATTLDTNQKSASDPPSNLHKQNTIPTSTTTTTTLDHRNRSSSFSQPLRRKTSPINSTTEPTSSMSREKSRRSSIFHFSKPKLSPMVHLPEGIQSSENLSTIRAVTNDQGTPTNNNNTYPFNDPLLESSSMSPSSSKQMPFSPDSFVSPHTQPYTTNPPDNHEYNNTNSFSQVNRPHTSHHPHDHRPNTATSNAEEGYRTSTTTNDQSQARKLKKSDHHHQNHQNRATKLFTKILI